MSLYQRTVLKNGTRVISVPSHDTQALTVLVQFEVGSRYETAALSGASHYIEHMMFKGTKRRPSTMDISRDLDAVGADYNAFTGKDHTAYYIRLAATHADLAVDMLHDMLFHSAYAAKECGRERDVILEEINMYEDNPLMHAEEVLESEMYPDSPLGRVITGTHASMHGITREMLMTYRDRYYRPSRMVISIAGKIGPEVMPLIEKTFGAIKEPKTKDPAFARAEVRTGSPRLKLKFKDTEQVLAVLGFPGYHYGHNKLAALSVLTTLLGGGMSSRLFTQVRERRGLAYSVNADVSVYQDTGTFTVFAGLAKPKLEEGIRTILSELGKVVKNGVTAEETLRAKEYIKGKTVLALESSSALAGFFAKQELLTGKIDTPEDKLARISAVTRDDVRAVAAELFRTGKLTAAIIGPYKDPKPFMKLLKI